MDPTTPHFLLFAHVDRNGDSGQWRFVLRNKHSDYRVEVADAEPDLPAERLELLTVVRALESLDQPSRVTLMECSDYIWKGIRYGLSEWRGSDWRWEFFGQMVPVKNSDLWQRLDRALEFHDVECKRRRFDQSHGQMGVVKTVQTARNPGRGLRVKLSGWIKYAAWAVPLGVGRRFRAAAQSLQRGVGTRTALRSARFAHREMDTSASIVANG